MLVVQVMGKSKTKIMIQANELRIGNMVQIPDRRARVSAIFPTHFRATDKDGIDLGNSLQVNFNPIELTPDILVSHNFTEDNNGHFWKDLHSHYLEFIPMPDGFYPIWASVGEMSSEPEQRVSLNRINYVHQLQNLFWVLTGQELEIKPQ